MVTLWGDHMWVARVKRIYTTAYEMIHGAF